MLTAIDLFCGAGGTSTGLALATGGRYKLTAINHWDIAVETHARNHPNAEHLCKGIDTLDPRKVHKGKLDLLLASPECTHHSIARGGKPMEDQSRASAWEVVRWAEALCPRHIIVENVKEFESWGPLDSRAKRPLKSRKGETFRAWVQALRSLGYTVDSKVLNAADYGAATSRRRLFVVAQRGRGPIVWPHSTHARVPDLLTPRKWRAASEIIDWSIPGTSIFSRKKPLAPATLARIEAGLKRFGGAHVEPFLVILRQHQAGMSINAPVPTITASGAHVGLCQPFMLGQQSCAAPRGTSDPIPTIATSGAISVVQPFVLPQFSENRPRSVDDPVGAITTTSRGMGLVQPFIVGAGGQSGSGKPQSSDGPLGTVLVDDHRAIVQPFMVPFRSSREGQAPRVHSLEAPAPTVTTENAFGICQPFILPLNHGKRDLRSYSHFDPMPTITSVDAWGTVEPNTSGIGYDILFRMLQPHELAAAMGFPADYQFAGNRDQRVKQIGNAVEVNVARALIAAAIRRDAC